MSSIDWYLGIAIVKEKEEIVYYKEYINTSIYTITTL